MLLVVIADQYRFRQNTVSTGLRVCSLRFERSVGFNVRNGPARVALTFNHITCYTIWARRHGTLRSSAAAPPAAVSAGAGLPSAHTFLGRGALPGQLAAGLIGIGRGWARRGVAHERARFSGTAFHYRRKECRYTVREDSRMFKTWSIEY